MATSYPTSSSYQNRQSLQSLEAEIAKNEEEIAYREANAIKIAQQVEDIAEITVSLQKLVAEQQPMLGIFTTLCIKNDHSNNNKYTF